jgi:D-alanyl-D-alanine carboxypeptidase/D-alanyl-D-alanine-endopeptidase (penicillin-binding protein 4)
MPNLSLLVRRFAGISCLAVLAGLAHAQITADQVKAALDPIFDAPTWRNARWGVEVVDLATGEELYGRDTTKAFMPASNLKLYTTSAAVETLGADFRFQTNLYASGTTATKGVLRGDLVIVGSGDPSISGRYIQDMPTTAVLQKWAQAVKAAGIKRVEGSVVGDDDVFDDEGRTGSWQLDYYQEWYAAENSGLTMNDNCWDVTITPGRKVGEPAAIEPLLPTKYVKFVNHITTSAAKPRRGSTTASNDAATSADVAAAASDTSGSEESSDPPIEIIRELDHNEITLSGTIALGHEPYHDWGSIHNGTLFAATMLTEELQRQGIQVTGGAKDIDDLDATKKAGLKAKRGTLIHTHVSPPLSRIIAMINKPSQNFYADQLLKSLGAQAYGRGSYENGRRAVRDFLTTAGVQQTLGLRMSDGSGLSRQDMVEPQMTIALLRKVASGPNAKPFEESLPIMGVDGTLKTRLRGTPAYKNVHAKTGTINGVRSLSGYVTTKGGRRLAFCMMANNFTVPTRAATDAQDKALLKLIDIDAQRPSASASTTSTTQAGDQPSTSTAQ